MVCKPKLEDSFIGIVPDAFDTKVQRSMATILASIMGYLFKQVINSSKYGNDANAYALSKWGA